MTQEVSANRSLTVAALNARAACEHTGLVPEAVNDAWEYTESSGQPSRRDAGL